MLVCASLGMIILHSKLGQTIVTGYEDITTTHQNFSESVIETRFSMAGTSCLATNPLSKKGDPKTDVTADATNATKTVVWRNRVMALALWWEFSEGKK